MEDFAKTILDAGMALASQDKSLQDTPYVVVPEDYDLRSVEKYQTNPNHATGGMDAVTVEAFIEYYERYSQPDTSVIFADLRTFTMLGVIDWHAEHTPGFGFHRVVYTAPRTEEWQAWCKNDGVKMAQQDFAYFIEERMEDIRSPLGAEVLEIAQHLEAKKNVDFVSGQRLSDGQREFTYVETIGTAQSRNQITVPETFVLGLPIFYGGEFYEVTARLRYRINERRLIFWYDLSHRVQLEQTAFNLIVDDVREKVTTPVFAGAIRHGVGNGEIHLRA